MIDYEIDYFPRLGDESNTSLDGVPAEGDVMVLKCVDGQTFEVGMFWYVPSVGLYTFRGKGGELDGVWFEEPELLEELVTHYSSDYAAAVEQISLMSAAP